jgi:hypothetical protein
MTWSGSVAWRMPRKKPRAIMESSVIIYPGTAAEAREGMRRFSRSSRYSVIPSPTWQMICRLACPAALPESFLSLPPCLILQHPLALIFDKCRIRAVALAFLLCNKHLRNTCTAILFGMPAVADGNLIELNPANDYSCRSCEDGRWEPLRSRKARYTYARMEESKSASRARRSN